MEPSIEAEAIQPDLSKETFELCGKTIRIKPLKLRHQLELAALLEPAIGSAAYQVVDYGKWQAFCTLFAHGLKHYGLFVDFLLLLAANDNVELIREELLDSDIQLSEMKSITLRFVEKDTELGLPISRFFQALKVEAKELEAKGMKILEHLQAINFTFADSSQDSVNPTDGDLATA